MKKTAFLLIAITILSKIIGLGRDVVLSYFYGASGTTDAFLISLTIPTVIFAFIGKAISTGYIPLYSRIEKDSGVEKANDFTSNLINMLSILSILLTGLGFVFAEQIVKIFASGFESETLFLAVMLTRYSLVGILFLALVHVFNGFLQLKGNFAAPALIGLPMNACLILAIIFSSRGNLELLGIGILLSTLMQFVFLLYFMMKKNYRYRPIVDIKDPNIRQMVYLAIPVILGVAVNDINQIVDRTLASQIAEGGISALSYANRLSSFVRSIVVTSIATAMYPLITNLARDERIGELKNTLRQAITGMNLLVVPATVGFIVLAYPIINLLYGRGAFDNNAVLATADVLIYYSIGMLGIGMREVLSRPFYALQDTKTPMINAAIGMGTNITLNFILSYYLGLNGLALATSISAWLTALLMFIDLRKKIGAFGAKNITWSLLKVLTSSLVMGMVVYHSYARLSSVINSQSVVLLLGISIGVLVYFAVISLMKIDEVDGLWKSLKRKLIGNHTSSSD